MRICQGLRWRCDINVNVKNSELDKQYDAWLCNFFFIYVYLSYIIYFKESKIITTEKKKPNTKIYRHEEDKSLPILLDYVLQETKFFLFFFFFFSICLKLEPVSFCFLYNYREGTSLFFFLYLFSYFFLSFSSFRE